jgi:hypothetical protein
MQCSKRRLRSPATARGNPGDECGGCSCRSNFLSTRPFHDATKVILCRNGDGKPTAYGVQVAAGAAFPVSSTFDGKKTLELRNVTVKYEVIVSAGAFQSLQLVSYLLFGPFSSFSLLMESS